MEITCSRCHQTIQTDDCYCPACGLPQLLYAAEGVSGQAQPEQWSEAVRDASEVAWKPALRVALILAVPAGLLCSLFSPVNLLGLLWMSMAASWAVILYMRSQRPTWITVGAGARIGLVTGLLGAWMAAAATGVTLFVMRFFLHQGKVFDETWQTLINDQVSRQWTAAGVDAQSIAAYRGWLLSPEGRAGLMLGFVVFLMAVLILFAVGGGALGARMQTRGRRPEV
jgi:RNA polymerase subunit RPABC4/transcription elongation factor Spt4